MYTWTINVFMDHEKDQKGDRSRKRVIHLREKGLAKVYTMCIDRFAFCIALTLPLVRFCSFKRFWNAQNLIFLLIITKLNILERSSAIDRFYENMQPHCQKILIKLQCLLCVTTVNCGRIYQHCHCHCLNIIGLTLYLGSDTDNVDFVPHAHDMLENN